MTPTGLILVRDLGMVMMGLGVYLMLRTHQKATWTSVWTGNHLYAYIYPALSVILGYTFMNVQ